MCAPTILLAEDEAVIRTMLARVLERRGARVLTACDGAEALRIFGEHADEVCALVLDVIMPQLEGPQALARIRELRPNVPAVLMSGYAPSNPELAWLVRSGVRFIVKPFRVIELVSVLREMTGSLA